MFRSIKNFLSYLWFVLALDYTQLAATIIDIIILFLSILKWNEIIAKPSVVLLLLAVFTNFIWQVFNVASHFSFLKKEDPRAPLMSLLKKDKSGAKDFTPITVEENLFKQAFPYVRDDELGVLENPSVDALLMDSQVSIAPELSKNKRQATRTYVTQYKETLLKFLNHRWYEIQQKQGCFTNDKKVCLTSEIYHKSDGSIGWRVASGRYYHGYLTNFIYTRFVGGTHYKLYPPMNMNTDPIKALGESDFSDHIGVSTLLYTKDGYFYVFRQAGNAGYNANYYMPTGSGSMDYKDFKGGGDLRQIVIRAAERELAEESSIKKLMGKSVFKDCVHTIVVGYYRDMERGGKPEFCCVSFIDKEINEIGEFIQTSEKEIAQNSRIAVLFSNTDQWQEILPEASLSLKMNYKYLVGYMMAFNRNKQQ